MVPSSDRSSQDVVPHARPHRSPSKIDPAKCYRRAVSAWEDGDYARCLQFLADVPDRRLTSHCILLYARALIASGLLTSAQDWLSTHNRHAECDELATHAMLMGTIHARRADFKAADRCFDEARKLRPHRTIAAENDYQQAVARYEVGDWEGSRALLTAARRPIEQIVCARARSLLGLIATVENDSETALSHFKGALDVLTHCSAKDTPLHACVLCAVALLKTELRNADPAWLEAEASKVRWTPNVIGEHVQALRHIGTAHQRRGDHVTACVRFLTICEIAPGTPWSILGYADCSGSALCCGETRHAEAFATSPRESPQRFVGT